MSYAAFFVASPPLSRRDGNSILSWHQPTAPSLTPTCPARLVRLQCAHSISMQQAGNSSQRNRESKKGGRGRPRYTLPEKKNMKPDIGLGESERLQKVMSRMGVASRRESEALIAAGKVSVNGSVVRDQGVRVNSRKDVIYVDGKKVEIQEKSVWVAVHKPPGYLSYAGPKGGCVLDLVPNGRKLKLATVGAIDEDASGLVLLTNERGHVRELSLPDNRHVKEWLVDCEGIIGGGTIAALRKGVRLSGDDRVSCAAGLTIVGSGKVHMEGKGKMNMTRIEVRVRDSRRHLIERMFEAVNIKVVRSSRRRFGPVLLGSLKRGAFRYLSANEIKALKRGVH